MSSQCDGDDRELATRKACFSFELDSAVFRIGPPFIRLGPLSMNRVPKWQEGSLVASPIHSSTTVPLTLHVLDPILAVL